MDSHCAHGVSTDTPCVKCALANATGAPFDEAIKPASLPVAPSPSLISEINAPVDPEFMSDRMARWMDLSPLSPAVEPVEAFTAGVESERSRIRAIISHTYGNDWHGQKVLDAIDSGLTVEQLKEGKR